MPAEVECSSTATCGQRSTRDHCACEQACTPATLDSRRDIFIFAIVISLVRMQALRHLRLAAAPRFILSRFMSKSSGGHVDHEATLRELNEEIGGFLGTVKEEEIAEPSGERANWQDALAAYSSRQGGGDTRLTPVPQLGASSCSCSCCRLPRAIHVHLHLSGSAQQSEHASSPTPSGAAVTAGGCGDTHVHVHLPPLLR